MSAFSHRKIPQVLAYRDRLNGSILISNVKSPALEEPSEIVGAAESWIMVRIQLMTVVTYDRSVIDISTS